MKKAAAFTVTVLLTLMTIALLFITFSRGSYWFILLIVWLPVFWLVTAMLGHPAKGSDTSTDDGPFIMD